MTYAITLLDRTCTAQRCWVGYHTKRQAISEAKKLVTADLPAAEVYRCLGNGLDPEDVAFVYRHITKVTVSLY